MASPNKLSLGSVDIGIGKDGEDVRTLECTMQAMKNINRHFGGILAAAPRLAAGDIEAYATIIRYGTGVSDIDVPSITRGIWERGIQRLVEPLSNYLSMLSNGGKLPSEDDGTKAPGDDEGQDMGGN